MSTKQHSCFKLAAMAALLTANTSLATNWTTIGSFDTTVQLTRHLDGYINGTVSWAHIIPDSTASNTDGWVAFSGDNHNVEFWRVDANRETITCVELDAWGGANQYGIKKTVSLTSNRVVFTWQHRCRKALRFDTCQYEFRVMDSAGNVLHSFAPDASTFSDQAWSRQVVAFDVNPDITQVQVAFVPTGPDATKTDGAGVIIDSVQMGDFQSLDLVPVLIDRKSAATPDDDQTINLAAAADAVTPDNVAWIAAHSGENIPARLAQLVENGSIGTPEQNPGKSIELLQEEFYAGIDIPDADLQPRMPQLEVLPAYRVAGNPALLGSLPDGVSLQARLTVQYNRGNGERINLNQVDQEEQPGDRSIFPAAEGQYHTLNAAAMSWKIWQDYAAAPFFGGDATLNWKINDELQPARFFRIGGSNPDDLAARIYIAKQNIALANGSMWYAYAIARHETMDYNNQGSRYNHFYEPFVAGSSNYQQTREAHFSRPRWNNDGWEDNRPLPGGYGLFQVTANGTNKFFNIPRQQIWNWQVNVEAAFAILRVKEEEAIEKIADRREECRTETGGDIMIPTLTLNRRDDEPGTLEGDFVDGVPAVIRHVFADLTMVEAVTIKRYNGARAYEPGTATGTGDFCVWRNRDTNPPGYERWEFRRWKTRTNQVSYVEQVISEKEQ